MDASPGRTAGVSKSEREHHARSEKRAYDSASLSFCVAGPAGAPPARALRCSSMAPRLRSDVVRFDAVPEEALRVIVLALPVDSRARAACVCRSWRALLSDPSLWQVLDLTTAGGVATRRVTANLVRGAVARAAGQMRTLSFDDEPRWLAIPFWVRLIQSDGAEVQVLNAKGWLDLRQELDTVLAAAPRLQVFSTQVSGECAELLPVLRNDPPYGPLRVSGLDVHFGDHTPGQALAMAAAVAANEALKLLMLAGADSAPEVNALIVAAEQRVSYLTLDSCVLNADSVLALTRLLHRGSLTKLEVSCRRFPQEADVPALCVALRACRTLTYLKLRLQPTHGASRRSVTELLDAAAALPALSVLDLGLSVFQDINDAGRAFGALLRSNLPSLRILHVNDSRLGEEAMAALLDGLAANTHLHKLECRLNNVSEAFERDRLAPALVALAARAALDA